MKNFLKKLHIVQEHPSETSPPPSDSSHKPLLGFPGWLSSVAGKKPVVSSNSNSNSGGGSFAGGLVPVEMDGAPEGRRREKDLVEEEEEYQVQLAIELSAREDPEAVQIEAVKQISLGSCSPRNSPAEVLAYRYWNYNALSFDDKILDGFYDLYGILPESSAKMPSLIDLQGTTASSSICWDAVLVNHAGDPDLVILEQKALRMALDSKSGSIRFAGRTLVQKLASLVSEYMGGPVADNNVILQAWRSFRNTSRMNAGNIVLPLGQLTIGLARHRALLFKVLADSVGIPCQLVKGKAYTGSDDGAMNIVRLHDGREWIVDLMQDPGTLISSDAVGALGEFDDGSFTLNPSLGDAENFQVISCSSSASSTISCSSGNDTADKRSFGYFATSESDASNMGESHIEDNKKGKNVSEEVSKSAGNPHSQKAPLHETSPKQNQSHALARSPSWTEGIGSVAVRKMKVKDVSQYMIDATKENPKLAQKLHNVLLESGVAVPPNLFSEICSDQQENPTPETKNLYEHNNELSRGGTETTHLSKGQGSSVLPLSSSIEQNEQKAIQSRPQVDDLRPVAGLGFQNPLDMAVSCQSQSEEHCLQQQPSPMKLMDNMPVAAAVATAAIVASSMFVAASKSGTDANVEVPVSTAATATAAAVVATTAAANMQYEKLLHHQHFPAITRFSDAELVGQKTKGKSPSDENQGSAQTSDGLSESEQRISEAQHKTERTSDKSVGIGSIKSDGSLEDVAEFEIPWEEIVLGERIGLGSYGEVYRGDWHGTEVAVKKFLEQDLSGDALEEFKSEVRIMKRLRHPNVVLFMGAVVHVPNLSIITEFLPRGSLFRLIHRPNNQLDERRRLKMALDVARGMNYLHSCSPAIVHRDLKSPNLLVDKNWVVKVCDFGLSRIKHNTFLSSKSTAGTAEWMAPEVLRNEPSDEKCDVYSFGVILWELCTLKQPWGGMNPMQVVGAVGFQHRRLDVPGDMDPAIADIITKCWQTDPKQRPSFSEIMAALKPLLKPVSNSPTARQKTTSSSGTC